VTNSLAFMMLQKLVNERKIREHEAENYRNLYRKLNDKVIDVYENETRLYTFNTKLQRQLVDLRRSLEEKNKNILQMKAKCEELKMKKDQMQEKVEAKVLEVKVVDNELKSCRDDKRDKEGNLEHIIKCSEDAARPMIEDFNRKLRDCTEEIKLQNENSVKENEARELYLDEIEKLKMQIEDLHRDKLEKRRVLSQNFNKPDRIRAEADVFSRERAKKEKEALTLLQKIQTLKSQVAEKTTKRDKVKLHVDHYKQKITRHRGLLGKKANNLADLERKMETQKLKNMELLMRRQALGIEIEDQRSKCQAVHRRMKRHQSTNRNELRRCENLRRKYETINAIIPSMIDQRNVFENDVKLKRQQIVKIQDQIDSLLHDKDLLMDLHLDIEDVDKEANEQLHAAKEKAKESKRKIELMQKKEIQLRREISRWSAKRELQVLETSRAIVDFKDVKEQLKVKNLILEDLDKQEKDINLRIIMHKEEYKKVKSMKEKYVNQVQITEQQLNEIREKISILRHEVQILHQESQIRDAAFKEEYRNHQIQIQKRIYKRDMRNKLRAEHKKLKQQQEHHIKEIQQLNLVVNSIAKKVKKLQKRFSDGVDERNAAGIRVIDRSDELKILKEKAKIQENMLSNGKKELKIREDQIMNLKREVAEHVRALEALASKIPSQDLWRSMRRTLEINQNVLEQERKEVNKLSKALATPDAPRGDGKSRINILKGFDPDSDQLSTKIEVLEEKLAEKKEILFEKDLILHEVTSLGDKLCKQAAENRSWTLEAAKKINEQQAQIRAITRSMMATVSELSMYQATAMKLEHQKETQMQNYDEARERMLHGDAPTEEAEREWIRMLREKQRQRDLLVARKKQIEALMKARPGDTPTMADVRPNAYLPDDIGIPKPYGLHAPFKPSIIGANMRHIRRPAKRLEQLPHT